MRALARQERAKRGRARDTDAAESSGEVAHWRAIRSPRKAHLREEGTSEHAETNAELGEVEEGAGRRRGAGNKAKGARGAPMAGGGAVRAERRRESGRESERARTGGGENGKCAGTVHSEGGGHGVGEPRMPSTRRRRPDTVGRARGAAVSERGEGE